MVRKREEHHRGNTNAAPRARANASGPTENWEDLLLEQPHSHPPTDDYRPFKDSYILLAWKSGEIVIHFLRDFFICFLLSTLWQHLRRGREGGSSFHRYRKRLGTERFDAFVAFLTIDSLRNREGLPPPVSKHQLIIIIIIGSDFFQT
ncbi:unnamed protein product [Sphagnum jensenii]|uniref:Maturase K n=1 Tax=Sphagnum jensenii TaxID=128206 RepID=A0ABP1BPI4_9BRYO